MRCVFCNRPKAKAQDWVDYDMGYPVDCIDLCWSEDRCWPTPFGIAHDVEVDYTNWRGERRVRRIFPLKFYFGSNQWHQNPQWLLNAIDVELMQPRTFAMSGIHRWTQLPGF